MKEQLWIWLERARHRTGELAALAWRGLVAADRRLRHAAGRSRVFLADLWLEARVAERWGRFKPRLAGAAQACLAALGEAWRIVRPPLLFGLQVVAALIVLFEEWGWRPLAAFLASLTRFELWARLERAIAGLPPYGALMALAVPTSILFPLKFVALYLLAQGQAVAATALFIAAKIASTALIARIFILTKPALMRIGWFAAAYDWLVPWQEAMFAMIRSSWVWRYGRMVKTRVRLEATRIWSGIRPRLAAAARQVSDAARRAWGRLKPRLATESLRLRLMLRRTFGRYRLG
jgi:hypothetical protein